MTRRRVQLKYIQNRRARKLTLKKRKEGLVKKVSEISVLCNVKACVIIYGPEDDVPTIWPPTPLEVGQVIKMFLNISELERSKKMINHGSYLTERLEKTTKHLLDVQMASKKIELDILMHNIFSKGRPLDIIDHHELQALIIYMNQRINEVERKLQNDHTLSSLSPFRQIGQSVYYEVGQSSQVNENYSDELFLNKKIWLQNIPTDSNTNISMLQCSKPSGYSKNSFLQYGIAISDNNNIEPPAMVGYTSNNMQLSTVVGYDKKCFLHQHIPEHRDVYALSSSVMVLDNKSELQTTGVSHINNSMGISLSGVPGLDATNLSYNRFIKDPYTMFERYNDVSLANLYAGDLNRNVGNIRCSMGNHPQESFFRQGLPQLGGSMGSPMEISKHGGGISYSMGISMHQPGHMRPGMEMHTQEGGGTKYIQGKEGGNIGHATEITAQQVGGTEVRAMMSTQGVTGNIEHKNGMQLQGYYTNSNVTNLMSLYAEDAMRGKPEIRINDFENGVPSEEYCLGNSVVTALETLNGDDNALVSDQFTDQFLNYEHEEGTRNHC